MAIEYRGKKFPGYNKPIKSDSPNKKKMVLAKEGSKIKIVRFGDPKMRIKKEIPARRKSFRARHKCDTKKSKLSAGYWSCKAW